jgi:hypothetical protein
MLDKPNRQLPIHRCPFIAKALRFNFHAIEVFHCRGQSSRSRGYGAGRCINISFLPKLCYCITFGLLFLTTLLFCSKVYLMPPMYRECPFWYKRNFAQISASFTSAFRQPIGHTFALASYTNPTFERDGIHLTEDDGLKYVDSNHYI